MIRGLLRRWLAAQLEALASRLRAPDRRVTFDRVRAQSTAGDNPGDRLPTAAELQGRGIVPLDVAREQLRRDAEEGLW